MTKTLFLLKDGAVFRPHGGASQEVFEELRGKEFRAKLEQPRSIGYHRRYFALLHELLKHQSIFNSVDELRAAIAVAIGECNIIVVNGKTVAIPKSISFAAMDQTTFRDFCERAIDFIFMRVLPSLDSPEARKRCLEILGGSDEIEYVVDR